MEAKTFGELIEKKRHERAITVRGISEMIGVSPGYYNDIEKNRRYPPDREILNRLIDALALNEAEKVLFFDLAGEARSDVAPDLPEYIMENDYVRTALRIAKEKASPDDWQRFIDNLERK